MRKRLREKGLLATIDEKRQTLTVRRSIEGSSSRCPVQECPIRTVYSEHRKHPQWKQFARLRAVYFLKASGTVDHILDLSFGAVRSGQLPVKFRGRRQPKSGYPEPTTIELNGSCPLA